MKTEQEHLKEKGNVNFFKQGKEDVSETSEELNQMESLILAQDERWRHA